MWKEGPVYPLVLIFPGGESPGSCKLLFCYLELFAYKTHALAVV